MMTRLQSVISLALLASAPIWCIEVGLGAWRQGWPEHGWIGALVALGLIQAACLGASCVALIMIPKAAALDERVLDLWARRAEPDQTGAGLNLIAQLAGLAAGGGLALSMIPALSDVVATPLYNVVISVGAVIASLGLGWLIGRRVGAMLRPIQGVKLLSPAYLTLGAGVLGAMLYLALWWQRDLLFKEIDPWPLMAVALIGASAVVIGLFGDRLRSASPVAVLASIAFTAVLVVGFGRSPLSATSLSGHFSFSSLVAQQLRSRIDADGDGVSAWFGGGDCGPSDPMTFPGAIDLPDDGIDQDCFAGDLSSRQEGLDLNPRYAAQTKDAAPELIVLVSVDALRPDFVGFYGYSKHPTTPKLDRWARQAVVFDSAYTTGPYTTIAMPSLLTGLGMGQMPGYISDLFEERLSSPTVKLPASVDTLAEGLKSAGYKTHAIVSGFDVRLNDFDQGFDEAEVVTTRSLDTADQVTARARAWLAANPSGKRLLWLHYFDPHDPYFHGVQPNFGRSTKARYASSIAFMDQHLGGLLNELSAQPKTTTLIVSDHGESLGEKGKFGHGYNLHRHETRVVMAWRGPGFQPRRLRGAVSLVDVAPTLLNMAALQPKPSAGFSLLETLRGGAEELDRAVLTESYRRGQHFSVSTADWRLFYHLDQNRYELFNAQLDRMELNNLAPVNSKQVDVMRGRLLTLMNRGGTFVRRGMQVRDLIADRVPDAALLERPVRFGDSIELIGYEFGQGGDAEKPQHVATLYLRAIKRMDTSWRVAFGLSGPRAMNKDHFPGRSYFPTNRWPPGVIIKDPVILGTMSKFPSAHWRLTLGFYAGDERLQPQPDGALELSKSGTRVVLADRQLIVPMKWAVERDQLRREQMRAIEAARKEASAAKEKKEQKP